MGEGAPYVRDGRNVGLLLNWLIMLKAGANRNSLFPPVPVGNLSAALCNPRIRRIASAALGTRRELD